MINRSTINQSWFNSEFRKAPKLQLSFLSRILGTVAGVCLTVLFGISSAHAQLAFQGFESNTGDWADVTGTPGAGITRVPSGGGVLGVPSAAGNYHAEILNEPDTYLPGTGYGEYSFFGFTSPPPYTGDYSQSVSMYIDASWPVASPDTNGVGVWIDMSPGSNSVTNPNEFYGGEHNFRLTPTGSAVAVTVDAQTTPIVTITTTGWYRFEMTYQKGAHPTDLVTTVMNVFDNSATPNLKGTTTVLDNSDSQNLLSEDLAGPNYVWITVWDDNWPASGANDVLAIDNARADLLNPTKDNCKDGGWQNFALQPGPFKNQGQCVSYFAAGKGN